MIEVSNEEFEAQVLEQLVLKSTLTQGKLILCTELINTREAGKRRASVYSLNKVSGVTYRKGPFGFSYEHFNARMTSPAAMVVQGVKHSSGSMTLYLGNHGTLSFQFKPPIQAMEMVFECTKQGKEWVYTYQGQEADFLNPTLPGTL